MDSSGTSLPPLSPPLLPAAFFRLLKVDDESDGFRMRILRENSLVPVDVDWIETPDKHIFEADLPGVPKKDISLAVKDGRILTISGERRRKSVLPEVVEKDQALLWRLTERDSFGRFERKFPLPADVDVQKIVATAEDGVLTVTIPKVKKLKLENSRAIEIL